MQNSQSLLEERFKKDIGLRKQEKQDLAELIEGYGLYFQDPFN